MRGADTVLFSLRPAPRQLAVARFSGASSGVERRDAFGGGSGADETVADPRRQLGRLLARCGDVDRHRLFRQLAEAGGVDLEETSVVAALAGSGHVAWDIDR